MTDPEAAWQRARSPEQIAERRADILHAAGELIDEGGLDAAGLNAIARRVGLSKANLYRYFESREAILLDLTLDAFKAWCDHVQRDLTGLAEQPETPPVESVARILARQHARQPRLGLLVHALPGIIEHNISLETAIAFKGTALEHFHRTAERLTATLPNLCPENAMAFLWQWSVALGGAWPNCHPHPVIAEAMRHLGMDAMMQSYEDTIEQFAVAFIRELIDRH